jgi:hypothetical protein
MTGRHPKNNFLIEALRELFCRRLLITAFIGLGDGRLFLNLKPHPAS